MRLIYAVAAIFLSGCPPTIGRDAGLNGLSDGGMSGHGYCVGYAAAACARLLACGIAESGQVASCETLAMTRCNGAVTRSVEAGATRLADDALAKCQAAAAAAPCLLAEANIDRACLYGPGTRLPAGALGGKCEGWETCVEGTCDTSDSICGVCTASAAVDAPCGSCDPREAFCSPTGACERFRMDGAPCMRGDQCLSHTCSPLGRCGPVQRGDSCRFEGDCPASDFCSGVDLEPTNPGVCQPRTATGAACQHQRWDSAGGCELGTWCLDGRCVNPMAGTVNEGGTCSAPWQCGEGAGCLGLYAPFEYGHCITPQLNQACSQAAELCPGGARCILRADGGICLPLRGLGEPCTREDSRWDDCRVGLACSNSADGGRACAPLRAIGGRCTEDDQCLTRHCLSGTCRSPGEPGAPCITPQHCASLTCVFSTSVTNGNCATACF